MTLRVNGKAFLLGVGCQKGGTSWLHDYLTQSAQTDFGPMKEYHVFDELDLRNEQEQEQAMMRLKRKMERKNEEGAESNSGLRYNFRIDTNNYFDYFTNILSSEQIMLTGDITPSYSGLSADRYQLIKNGFALRGIPVKVIFLMRDPVERIWSSARMKLWGEKTARRQADIVRTGDETLLLRMYKQRPVQFRTNYHLTIEALEQVFESENILYEFYEQLFTPEATRRICDFLQLPYIEPKFEKAVNSSPKTNEISAEVARKVARAYSDVYSFVTERFGADFVASIWPHVKYAQV